MKTALLLDDGESNTFVTSSRSTGDDLRATPIVNGAAPYTPEPNARLKFRMHTRGGEKLIDRSATIEDSEFVYQWRRSDLEPGLYHARFELRKPDGRRIEFPNDLPLKIVIRQ